MKLNNMTFCVPDVKQTLAWYEQAFGINASFLDEGGEYGEIRTQGLTLAFVSEKAMGEFHLAFRPHRAHEIPEGSILSWVSDNVDQDYARLLDLSGAMSIQEPIDRPWGQRIAIIRDLNGRMIEICSACPTS